MITYDDMIESIQIFRKYAASGSDKMPLSIFDENMYLTVESRSFSEEDIQRLEELGWHAETDWFAIDIQSGI